LPPFLSALRLAGVNLRNVKRVQIYFEDDDGVIGRAEASEILAIDWRTTERDRDLLTMELAISALSIETGS